MTSVTITEATPADAEEIIAVQRLAFASQGELYSTCDIPPLVETSDDLRADFEKSVVLKAVADGRDHGRAGGRIVGSVRGRPKEEDACFVARLAVLPDLQDRGIGSLLMNEIEARFPTVARFELVTGHRSEKSLHLYRKLGYLPARTKAVSDRITLVFMEKAARRGSRREGGDA